MTNYYVNNITGSDSNNGTSEATAWNSIEFSLGPTAGITNGDTLWVKGTTAAYTSFNKTFADLKPRVRVMGYSGVTGDDCSSGIMPEVDGNWNLDKAELRNFRIDTSRSAWFGSALNLSSDDFDSYYENLHYTITDTANTSIGVGYVTTDSRQQTIRAVNLTVLDTTPSAQVNSSGRGIFFTGNGGSRTSTEGCILDARDVVGGNAGLIYIDNTGFSTLSHEGSIFLGNPAESQMGLNYVISSSTSRLSIKKCIFYNLDVGINLTTSLTDNSSLTLNNNSDWIIEDCVFVNCGTGIYLDPNITKWNSLTIKNCVFYNMTSYEINGDANILKNISATQNPYDPDNYCLSDYGNTLIDYPYRTWNGSSFVINERRQLMVSPIRKFGTSDSGFLSLGTGGVGDTVTVSGRSFQKVDDDPIVWRRVRV